MGLGSRSALHISQVIALFECQRPLFILTKVRIKDRTRIEDRKESRQHDKSLERQISCYFTKFS